MKPMPDLPQRRNKCEPQSWDPYRRTEGTQQCERRAQHRYRRMPLLVLHHAEVFAEGKITHRVKREEIHEVIDDNRA